MRTQWKSILWFRIPPRICNHAHKCFKIKQKNSGAETHLKLVDAVIDNFDIPVVGADAALYSKDVSTANSHCGSKAR